MLAPNVGHIENEKKRTYMIRSSSRRENQKEKELKE